MAHLDKTDANKNEEVMHILFSNELISDLVNEFQQLKVKIEIPTESEECAICLDKIEECEVAGFENLIFDVTRPTHKKIILPCTHSFSTNALLVHWLTSSMRCPLCRAGVDGKLGIQYLPEHWKFPATTYVNKHLQEQAEIDEREAAETAMHAIAEDMVIYNRYLHVSMHLLLVTDGGVVHRIPMNFAQSINTSTGDFWMHVTRSDVRKIASVVNKQGCYAMTLAVYSHVATSGDNETDIAERGVELANSGLMRLPHACHIGTDDQNSNEFTSQGNVSVARTGQNLNFPTVAQNSSFLVQWFYQNDKMLDTLLTIEFRIKLNALMVLVAETTPDLQEPLADYNHSSLS